MPKIEQNTEENLNRELQKRLLTVMVNKQPLVLEEQDYAKPHIITSRYVSFPDSQIKRAKINDSHLEVLRASGIYHGTEDKGKLDENGHVKENAYELVHVFDAPKMQEFLDLESHKPHKATHERVNTRSGSTDLGLIF